MANALYPLWKQALMQELAKDKSLDLGGDQPENGVYCALLTIENGYVYSDTHQFYTDLTNVQASPALITTPVVTGRIFKGDTVVFTSVSGTSIGAIALYRRNAFGTDTWRLVLYEDTGIIGLPMILNGGNLIVTWATEGIFGL
jgi:hypothetical protein